MDLNRACAVWDFLEAEYNEVVRCDMPCFNVRMDKMSLLSCLRSIRWAVTDEISEAGTTGCVTVKSFHRGAERYCRGSTFTWESPEKYSATLALAVESAIEALKKEQFL